MICSSGIVIIMAENDIDRSQTEKLLKRIQELEQEVQQLKKEQINNKDSNVRGHSSGAGKAKRTFDFSAHGRRHVALRVAYLGWGYQGFASQENTTNTIEEKLFEALTKTRLVESRQTSNYHRCGRTDKGVSAFGQVRASILFLKVIEEYSRHTIIEQRFAFVKYIVFLKFHRSFLLTFVLSFQWPEIQKTVT